MASIKKCYVLTCELTITYGEWYTPETRPVKNPETNHSEFFTCAVSEKQAISNICFRMKQFGLNLKNHSCGDTEFCYNWKVEVKQ